MRVLDTSLAAGEDFAESGSELVVDPGDSYIVDPRSVVVLRI
jgi:hypothetical protein